MFLLCVAITNKRSIEFPCVDDTQTTNKTLLLWSSLIETNDKVWIWGKNWKFHSHFNMSWFGLKCFWPDSLPSFRVGIATFSFLLTEPDWASYTLGIFVCLNCSGIHRNLPAISKVKSIRLDRWEDSLVEVSAQCCYDYCNNTFIYIFPAYILSVILHILAIAAYLVLTFAMRDAVHAGGGEPCSKSHLWEMRPCLLLPAAGERLHVRFFPPLSIKLPHDHRRSE